MKKLLLFFVMVLCSGQAWAYTCTAVAGGGNWNDASTWAGSCNSTYPQTGDDVVFNASSGSVTLPNAATNTINSLDMTGFTGNLTGGGFSTILTIKNSTGTVNNVLAGTINGTWDGSATLTFATNSVMNLSTSGVVSYPTNFIINLGSTTGSFSGTINLTDSMAYTSSGDSLKIIKGTVNFDPSLSGLTHSIYKIDFNNTNTKTISFGNSVITVSGASTTVVSAGATGTTISANSATLVFTGASSIFSAGAIDYNGLTIRATNTGSFTLSGGTFKTIELSPSSGAATNALSLSGDITVTNALTINGTSRRYQYFISSSVLGTTRTITNTGATITATNCDFRDIALTTAKDFSAQTDIGDAGGNSGITFPASTTQVATNASGTKNWYDSIWTSRQPLPQDDVSMTGITGGTIATSGVIRLARGIDWTGATGSPTFSINTTATTMYGSLTLISGMTFTTSVGMTFGSQARTGINTYDFAGKTITSTATFNTHNATAKLLSNFTSTGTSGVVLDRSFNANGFNVSAVYITSSSPSTCNINLGSGTWSLSRAGTVWSADSSWDVIPDGSTISITDTSSTAKTFAGNSKTYNNLSIAGGGSGAVTISGSNTFNTITIGTPKTVTFTSGTTQTINELVAPTGITLNASTGGSVANLAKSNSRKCCQLGTLTITDINVTPTNTFLVGSGSTISNSTGWNTTNACFNIKAGGVKMSGVKIK